MARVGGEVVTYQHRQGGPTFMARAVFSQPEDTDGAAFMRAGKASVRVQAVIAAAEIAPGRPEKGDMIAIGSEKAWKVETSIPSACRGRTEHHGPHDLP
jgi:hypothetical protein